MFIFFIFVGCANKEYIFVPTNAKCIKKTDVKIGVEVNLPYYMNDLEIMKLKGFRLVSTDKYLSKNPSEIIITKLSNELCDPNVFIYPWGDRVDYKVNIKIDDFYLKKDKIIFNARIYINNKFFKINLIEKCQNNYRCINKAFDIITNKIIKEIK